MLSRRSGVEDRRVAHLTLTAAGAARLATWRDRRAEVLAASLDDLTADDRNALSAALPALERLIARLEQLDGEEP